MSALICNALVSHWGDQVAATGCGIAAFLDDRYILAQTHPQLLRGWMTSCVWEQERGWRVNPSKSAHVQLPPSSQAVDFVGTLVPKRKHLTTLGIDLVLSPMQILAKQKERTAKALATARKIGQLSLPVSTSQTLY